MKNKFVIVLLICINHIVVLSSSEEKVDSAITWIGRHGSLRVDDVNNVDYDNNDFAKRLKEKMYAHNRHVWMVSSVYCTANILTTGLYCYNDFDNPEMYAIRRESFITNIAYTGLFITGLLFLDNF